MESKWIRRVKHFLRSGCIILSVEHFLVMFPSALLIAKIANFQTGEPVISLASILFACGVGTLLFIIFTRGKIPFFLGPSFSYIGFTSYCVAKISDVTQIAEIRSYIIWGYILAGIVLVVLGLLYRFDRVSRTIKFLFPDTVMGPAISLIGLELANVAISDAGLSGTDLHFKVLSIVTLLIIIIASLTKHSFLKNASVFVGILAGCIVSYFMGVFIVPKLTLKPFVKCPPLYFHIILNVPDNLFGLFVAVFPSAIIAFSESLGRIAVYDGMQKRDLPKEKTFTSKKLTYRTLVAHSFANLGAVVGGGIPNALYAENLAIMNLNSIEHSFQEEIVRDEDRFIVGLYSLHSVYPYVIASIISILVACIRVLQDLFTAIPMPVLGGMELFIFGLITAPGIQLLVDQHVDYKKVSNQIITASVLLAGVSGFSLNLKIVELKGMSLGLFIGVFVNLLTRALELLGILNDQLTLAEIVNICLDNYTDRVVVKFKGSGSLYDKYPIELHVKDLRGPLIREDFFNAVSKAKEIEFRYSADKKVMRIIHRNGDIYLYIKMYPDQCSRLCNDYKSITEVNNEGTLQVKVDKSISSRVLQDICKKCK